MPIAFTIAQGVEFSYEGTPAEGTTIEFGMNRTCAVSGYENRLLRAAFPQVAFVSVGASHDNPTAGSLGAWLRENIREKRAVASYVAAILVAAGWASRENSRTIRFE